MMYSSISAVSVNRFVRYFHKTSCCWYAVDKQSLSKLRKSTGFSFVNCRQALEKFNNDLKQAEEWLKDRAQKEGWAKASKLQSRLMSQGLIGIAAQEKAAAIVEVNCETDFVARNVKFQSLVSTVANACLRHGLSSSKNKVVFDSSLIGSLVVEDKSIADITALEVGNVGENIAVRRAVYLSASCENQHLATYVHSANSQASGQRGIMLGKYGSLVLCQSSSECSPSAMSDEVAVPIDELCRRLCQHVVGMNPSCVDGVRSDDGSEDDSRLLHQEYMHDTTLTVRDVLQQAGVEVTDFVRLECGEVLTEDGR